MSNIIHWIACISSVVTDSSPGTDDIFHMDHKTIREYFERIVVLESSPSADPILVKRLSYSMFAIPQSSQKSSLPKGKGYQDVSQYNIQG